MKVLLVNGSPHKEGNTNAALLEIARQLEKESIGTEVLWLGMDAVSGCRSCYVCSNLGKCVINDCVNTFLDKAAETDGFIFGSPVHFGSASGTLTSFMDRVFYADLLGKGNRFYLKPAAAITTPSLSIRNVMNAFRGKALRRTRRRAGTAYLMKPFFFRKSSATALAGSPPTWTRPLRSCSVTRSSFSKTGFRISSICGLAFSTASRMIGAGW